MESARNPNQKGEGEEGEKSEKKKQKQLIKEEKVKKTVDSKLKQDRLLKKFEELEETKMVWDGVAQKVSDKIAKLTETQKKAFNEACEKYKEKNGVKLSQVKKESAKKITDLNIDIDALTTKKLELEGKRDALYKQYSLDPLDEIESMIDKLNQEIRDIEKKLLVQTEKKLITKELGMLKEVQHTMNLPSLKKKLDAARSEANSSMSTYKSSMRTRFNREETEKQKNILVQVGHNIEGAAGKVKAITVHPMQTKKQLGEWQHLKAGRIASVKKYHDTLEAYKGTVRQLNTCLYQVDPSLGVPISAEFSTKPLTGVSDWNQSFLSTLEASKKKKEENTKEEEVVTSIPTTGMTLFVSQENNNNVPAQAKEAEPTIWDKDEVFSDEELAQEEGFDEEGKDVETDEQEKRNEPTR